ncbi:MAG TPA: class I SAM-dependent methyltransferase [Candidatus Paceibacterota bacterium]|nr:class I SAM-dependent methyltransferase [Candidatus Paceibacterota bacterium]HPT40356.1 class I SAM-dependent methyltransferase [Candidatus Paceibacterota bacterium]
MRDAWQNYFKHTKNKPPRQLLVKALSFVKKRDNTLDLGAGALNDSTHLLMEGFKHIVALDKESVALEIAKNLPLDKFEYVIKNFETFVFPKETFDLINAQYALPFISPDKFNEIFQKITLSLKSGGIFTGQLFGDRDGWRQNNKMNFHTKEDAEKILSSLEIIEFSEEEQDKPTAAGEMKHWHVFHFIAKK